MKKLLLYILCLLPSYIFSQIKIDSSYNNSYYEQKLAYFKKVDHYKRDIVWLGDSITEQGPWSEILNNSNMVNRGIGGDNTYGILARLDEVLQSSPKKIFIMAGINDLGRNLPLDITEKNFKRIVDYIKSKSPKTKIFIQSVLPLCESKLKFDYMRGKQKDILELNKCLQKLSQENNVEFINVYELFSNSNDELNCDLTNDGLHLKSEAYINWVAYLKAKKYL